MDLALDVVERDLLERDDVRVQPADDPGDPLEALVGDVAPPAGRERLAGADRGPDVPGRDPQRPEDYLT